jgi:hypothetical protein
MIDRSEIDDFETELRRNNRRRGDFGLQDGEDGPIITCSATGVSRKYKGNQWVYDFKLELEAGHFNKPQRKPLGFRS